MASLRQGQSQLICPVVGSIAVCSDFEFELELELESGRVSSITKYLVSKVSVDMIKFNTEMKKNEENEEMNVEKKKRRKLISYFLFLIFFPYENKTRTPPLVLCPVALRQEYALFLFMIQRSF